MERRIGSLEVRADGRRLSGTVLRFGDVSPSHRERFEPRAFAFAEAVPLNLSHDRERAVAWQPGGGLELRQDGNALSMVADLPPIPAADKALAMVRAGQATGLSVEFTSLSETRSGDIRVVESALLIGIGLVRSPAYEQSRVEARRRKAPRRWVSGGVEYGVEAFCECLKGECNRVKFMPKALRQVDDVDVLAVTGRNSEAIGSTQGGTLRLDDTDTGLEWALSPDARDTAAGKALEDLRKAGVNVYARPIVDEAASEFEDKGGVREYTRAVLKNLLVKPIAGEASRRQGWKPISFSDDTPEPPARRRSALWRL